MKNIFTLFFIIFLATSCSDDITFNKVAFEGLKNNIVWKASSYSAVVASNGSVTIVGSYASEKVSLITSSATKGLFVLGGSSVAKAFFDNTLDVVPINFDTVNADANGTIEITKYDGATISGTFSFNAYNPDEESDQEIISFQKGVFNEIPVKKL